MECTRVKFLEVEPPTGIEFVQLMGGGCSFKHAVGEGVKQEKEGDRTTQGLHSRSAFGSSMGMGSCMSPITVLPP